MKRQEILALGRDVLTLEAETIIDTSFGLGESGFAEAIELIYKCTGHVILLGLGKSGYVGKKVAATFSSTGTPSFFLHPVEARHGDMGVVKKNDLAILISYSGESEELISLVPIFENLHVKTISITGNSVSSLAEKNKCAYSVIGTQRGLSSQPSPYGKQQRYIGAGRCFGNSRDADAWIYKV